MKFQNHSFKKILNRRMDKQKDGQAESNMLPTFSKLGASKVKTVDFSETFAACDLKAGRCRQLKVCEY